jgi:hypothetical protein
MAAITAEHLKRRQTAMVAEKQLHEQGWKDCYDMTMPARAHGLMSEVISASDAQQRKAVIFDSTAADSCKVGSASVMGTMVPSSVQWFDIDVGQTTDEETQFLDVFAKFMWRNIHASNFDAESMDAMLDSMIAGWFVLFITEAEGGGYHFETWPIGECQISSTKPGGRVDVISRKFTLNVAQVVENYGIDNVSQKTRDLYNDKKFDDKVSLLLLIEPRAVYGQGPKTSRTMPFSSCHMELDTNHILRESGFEEFPCAVPRWSRLPASSYATGPMSDALADVRTLNEMVKWDLMGSETVIAPPMIAEDDGVLNPRNIKMGPRKIIVANSVDSMKPLVTGARVDIAEMKIARLQGNIRKILLADQLPPADGPVKTAYEWSVRVDVMRKMLGPMFGRFQSEWLQTLIERIFGITWRANIVSGFALVGRPPQSLLNRNFSVRYLNPLARAQRLEDVAAMDRFEMDLGAQAQAGMTDALDVYDWDAARREKSQLLGVPQKLIRDERQLRKARAARGQAAQAAQENAIDVQGQVAQQDAMAKRMAQAA